MKEAYIVTGGSKGLGAAFIQELIGTDAQVHCISRTVSAQLQEEASRSGQDLRFHAYDLTNPQGIEALMSRIISDTSLSQVDSITLINNAGMLEPIAPIGLTDISTLAQNMQVNLIAPMLLTSSFVKYTAGMSIAKRVANISSGAGKKPYPGWGAYCTAKAGLDMLTRCVGVEQEGLSHPARIVSIAPGVIDTDMQQLIRETPEELFPQVSRFHQLKDQGKLQTPADTAKKILRLLREDQFKQGDVIDIRDL